MGRIGGAIRTVLCCAALMLMALPGISAAAEQGGMGGMQHGDHAGMKMDDPGKMKPGAHASRSGEKIFSGMAGPWTVEARMIDMKAQMEQSGVSAKTAAKFAGQRHLMLFLADAKSGKPADGVAGTVVITGPDKASSSKVTLIVMGGHIGSDVALPVPGKYTFKADIESAGGKGSATFSYTLK